MIQLISSIIPMLATPEKKSAVAEVDIQGIWLLTLIQLEKNESGL